MNMRFNSTTVSGSGRGKGLGFPTVNMRIPTSLPLTLQQGVHAARAIINDEKYNGALYYGPALTFGDKKVALEIYLLDTSSFYLAEGEPIEIEVVKFIRPVMEFGLPELLINQMAQDVTAVRNVLKI